MSQKAKPTKQTGGTDIRSFFGGGGARVGGGSTSNVNASQSTSQLRTQQLTKPTTPSKHFGLKDKAVIDIDMDDDDIIDIDEKPSKHKSPNTTNTANGVKRKRPALVVNSSDEDEDVKKFTPAKKKASPIPTKVEKKPAATPLKTKAPSAVVTKEEKPTPKKLSPTRKNTQSGTVKKEKMKKPTKARRRVVDDDDDDDNDESYQEEEEEEEVKPKAKAKEKEKAKPKEKLIEPKVVKKEKEEDNAKRDSSKFNWAAAKAAKLAGPSAPGSKPIPNGEPNCLAGLSFVFTGELTSISRDEAIDLAKRFGGRVTGQPSSKTNFVILGDNAGPAKIRAIQKHGLKTLNEDEFLDLIATRKGVLDEKTKAKMEAEEKKIRDAAREMEKAERKIEKEAAKGSGGTGSVSGGHHTDLASQLWTVRYAPQSLKEICGNKTQVEKLQTWLHDWSSSLKSGFKKPGKNGMNIYRAVLVTGPPGIGKTTSAHLCAKLEGFTPIELNASDARSKKLVESGTNINNTSLDGWMGGGNATNVAGVAITDRTCLIMDEVDGMSAGDRGGVGALNALIKKTKVPIICIANDRNAQKLKPLVNTTFNLSFRKPDAAAVRSRVLTIAYKEKMKIPANVVDQLVEGAQSDIRQIINMLSTWKLSSDSMNFDEGKNLAKANEKYAIMTPFNIINKMLGPYLFSPNARESLGDKMELYFHDHAFVPLFIQENYLKTEPARVRNMTGPEQTLQRLRLMDKAASSISDGDLVDALIHGPEQHWSLMPLHAVTSAVRPASFVYGNGAGYGGPNAMSFPQWLGQNSKQSKLQRQLGDVQIRMRLKVSGDKPEIRQQYIPAMFPRLVKPLVDVGASAVEEVIETMDEYYLSKEEWDTIVELGLGDNKDDVVLKKIPTATKTSLTRKYNSTEHPVAFHKAQEFGKMPKKLAGGPAPDLEDAFDLDDDVEEEVESKEEEEDNDVSKDSLIKMAKGKGKGKASASASGKSARKK